MAMIQSKFLDPNMLSAAIAVGSVYGAQGRELINRDVRRRVSASLGVVLLVQQLHVNVILMLPCTNSFTPTFA